MICTLSNNQKERFLKKVYVDLKSQRESGKPFSLKDYMRSVYDTVKTATNNEELAQMYASITPAYVRLATSGNIGRDNAKYIAPLFADIVEAEEDLVDVSNLSKYISLPSPLQKLEVEVSQEQQQQINSSIAATEDKSIPTVYAPLFLAKVVSLSTTTGNSDTNENPQSYQFIQFMLDNNLLDSEKSGYYLGLMRGKGLLTDFDTTGPLRKENFIQVIVNKQGEPVYFSTDGSFTETTRENGRLVFFKVRSTLDSVQSAEEVAKNKNITVEEAREQLEKEKEILDQKFKFLNSNPNGVIVQEIIGGTYGYTDPIKGARFPLKNAEDLTDAVLGIDQVEGSQRKSFIRGPHRVAISFVMNPVEDNPELINDAINIFFGKADVVFGSTTRPITNSNTIKDLKKRLLLTLFGNNTKLTYDPKTDILAYNGEVIKNEEQFRAAITKTPDGKRSHVLNVKDKALDKIIFYKKEGNKYIVGEGVVTAKQYLRFVQDNASTEFPYGENGRFIEKNGYIQFGLNPLTYAALTKAEQIESDIIATDTELPQPETKEEPKRFTGAKKFEKKETIGPKAIDDILKDPETKNKIKAVKEANPEVTTKQMQDAKEWYESSPLARFIPYEAMFNMVNSENPNSVATFSVNGIRLFRGSDYTDLYHEAWHGFTGRVLTPTEKEKLYSEARNLSGTFKTFTGRTVSFKDATEDELEEWLAEDFRAFMLSDGKRALPSRPQTKSIFQKILDILKIMFNISIEDTMANYNASLYLNRVYSALRVGNINVNNINNDNSTLQPKNKIKTTSDEDPDLTNYEEVKKITDSLEGLFSLYVDEYNLSNPDSNFGVADIIENTKVIRDIYDWSRNKFIDSYEKLSAELESIDQEKQPDVYSRKYNALLTLEWALNNWGSIDNMESGVVGYHIQKSDWFNIEEIRAAIADETDYTEKLTNDRDGYSHKSGNEVSMKELAKKETLFVIKGLFKYKKKEGKDERTLEYELNEFGLPQLDSFDTNWNRVQKVLEGTTNPIEQYNILRKMAETDGFYSQLTNKLKNPVPVSGATTPSLSQNALWTDFYNVMSAYRIRLMQMVVDVSFDKESNEKVITVKTGIAQSEASRVGRDWNLALKNPINPNKYLVKLSPTASEKEKKEFKGNHFDKNSITRISNEFSQNKKYLNERLEFLRAIGINLSDRPEIRAALENQTTFLDYLMKRFKAITMEGQPKFKFYTIEDVLGKDPINLTRYNDLMRLEQKYSDLYSANMVSNSRNDPQYELSQKSTVSVRTDILNKANDFTSVLSNPLTADLNPERYPFARTSLILQRLFQRDGKKRLSSTAKNGIQKRAAIELLNSSGVSVTVNNEFQNIGIASSEADSTTYTLQNFFSLLQYGVAEGLRHSDKSTVILYKVISSDPNDKLYVNLEKFGRVITGEDFTSASSVIENTDGFTSVVDQMVHYLSSEVERIHKLRNDDPQGNMIVGDTTYKNAASKIVIFEDILGPELSKEIEDKYVSDNFYEAISEKPEVKTRIEQAITEYLRSQIDAFRNDLEETGALNKGLLMGNLRKMITRETTPVVAGIDTKDIKDEMLIATYVLNDWIHKYETSVLMYGDPALYNHLKEELHKRNAGVAATGIMPRTDDAINTFLESYKRRYAQSSWYKGLEVDPRVTTNTFNSAVLRDPQFDSVSYADYVEKAIESEEKRIKRELGRGLTEEEKKEIESQFKEYTGMKAGDGQGWITIDAYRDLLIRLGKWSKEQEKYYNNILDGTFNDVSKIAQYFPVMKMQYWGPLALTEGLPGIAMHKFSLAPLIPNVVKGTNLEILHNKLVEQGIDYALLQSGSKVNTLTTNGEADLFYSDVETRTPAFSDPAYKFTKNTIFLDFFKQQLETNDEFKEKTIFSTQLRKLVEEGLMENGVPISWEPGITDPAERMQKWEELPNEEKLKNPEYEKITRYENLIRSLTELKKKELLKETNLEYNEKTGKITGGLEKLLSFVEKELTRQDLAEHEINFIKYNPVTKGLGFDLSIHPSADKIEKLFSALIYKRLVRQKVKGEPLIQVSGIGYEMAQRFRKPEKEELLKYGTNGLSTYRLVKRVNPKTGKEETVTAAMKVKIAMQGDYKKLLFHPDVIELTKANPNLSRLDALNTLIKREEWLDKDDNRKMISLLGVRIPVQGLNSMESAEVYEFLPEIAGNIIIVPAEIVAKSGSDFDIDKLTMLMPSILKTSKGVKLITHNKENEDLDKDALKEELKGLKLQLTQAYKEFNDYTREQLASVDEVVKQETMEFLRLLNVEIKRIEEEILNQFELGNVYPEELYEELYSLHDEVRDVKTTISAPYRAYLNENVQPIIDKIDVIKEQLASGSGQGIENELLFVMQELLAIESNFTDLVTPNGTYIVKPLADKYADRVRKYNQYDTLSNNGQPYTYTKGKKQEKRISATRVFEIGYNRYKQQSNFIGKKTLGLGAVDNTYNTIFNRIGAYMSPNAQLGQGENSYTVTQRILMPYNKISTPDGDAISLSHLYDANKKYRISNLISQMMNGWVDVAKDSWIFDIQGNPELSPTLLFLIQSGVPVDNAVAFISQPLIREYVDKQRLIKSTFAKALDKDADVRQYRITAKREIFTDPKNGFRPNPNLINNKKQTKEILTNLSKEYLSNLDSETFSVENLDKRIKKDLGKITEFDRAVFVHFLELEEMAKATTAIKLGMNVDTSRESNISDLQERVSKIESLEYNPRFPKSIIKNIEENSPIGSFRIQEFALGILGELFKIRNHPRFLEFVAEEVSNYKWRSGKDQETQLDFVSDEDFRKTLVGDFAPFFFQNWLARQQQFETDGVYKSMIIKEGIPSVKTKYFDTGARVVDGVLYTDPKGLEIQYNNLGKDVKLTTQPTTPTKAQGPVSLGLAPITTPMYFGDRNSDKYRGEEGYLKGLAAFKKFSYEREFLRYIIPFEQFKETSIFKFRFDKIKKLMPQMDDASLSQRIYEEFLRNNAMFHTMNLKFMMMDEQGYAQSVMQIVEAFPNLVEEYSVLNSLIPDYRGGIKNLKFQEGMLDTDMLNIYHAQLKKLADPSVVKSTNQIENNYISNIFNLFSVFAFYQSGQDLKGFLSLVRATPTNFYEHLLSRAADDMLSYLNNEEQAERVLDQYKKEFLAQNRKPEESLSNRKRIKNYGRMYGDITPIITESNYDPDILLMSIDNVREAVNFVKASPNVVIPYDEASNPVGSASSKTGHTNTEIAKEGIEKGLSQNFVPVITKKARWVTSSDYFITDATYEDNVKMIDEFLEELDKRLQPGEDGIQKRLVFPKEGLGKALLGYKRAQTEEDKDKITPAPKTYLYLSKRLFERYGYINPGSRDLLKEEMMEVAKKMAPVTDEEVKNEILKCFYGE